MVDERMRHRAYTREVGDDMPDVRDWVWPGGGQDAGGPVRGEPA
jgi:xylulose-5-phosphate/fructose-6-phosphate phosphoketolase